MLGSMGHAAAMGLGVALSTLKKVIIIDGDGAVLMQMGSMATIGHYASGNLCHILLNNNAHESTGGQKNVSSTVNFINIAIACNYVKVFDVYAHNLEEVMHSIKLNHGPYFVHVNIAQDSKKLPERPTLSPQEIATRFAGFLQSDN
jgi:phosphonopyruvate decarboxylase